MLFIIQQVFIEYLPCAEKSWGRGIGRAVNKRDEGIVLLEFIFWYEKKIHWQNKHANMLVRKCSEIVAISTFRRGTLFQRQRNQIKTNSTTSTFFIFFTTKLIRGRIKNLIGINMGFTLLKYTYVLPAF